ncbi:filamentous hemagglutinin N-terminal domain-containing protein [Comamonas antarctica]|uniref:Filamentous hemagglutinin N-terminal domain-containing protein n=1 Tax=Comamonas antarctica TaxID=2743470 RepID=A0A6N1X0V6_9BURK|nr:filamentous hemagglutinin N-terminal domain-containing protein [Comamonas antarctica]QKV52999.1 filamentous hemagglutinin N-terminal domain-containing protein [Comamonas antarctica]
MFRLRRTVVWPVIATQAAMAIPMPLLAQTLPSGGRVTAGQASIGLPANGSLLINQASQRAAIRWNDFSIGQGNSVVFKQAAPGASILNIVTGGQASQLAGSMNANGAVFLVNPQGIHVTPTGRIDAAGGFVASTLGLSEADFMAGRLSFSGAGGAVTNQGRISTGAGGLVALIGSTVSNSGTVMAPLGKVGLGAAQAATLDWSGDGFLQVTLPSDATTADGQALVTNSGTIQAEGGLVTLQAATVAQAVRNAVNMPGSISARSVSGRNGAIVLDGGAGGATQVAGRLDVSASADAASAGRIDITGQSVALQGAVLDASGNQTGGTVRIGGGFQGGKAQVDPAAPLALAFGQAIQAPALNSAQQTSVDSASSIDVSARGAEGRGGSAVVWSESSTAMQGQVVGTGAASGGAVEISSAAKVQTVALDKLKLGPGGQILLDPQDIQINARYKDPATTTFLTDDDIRSLLNAGTTVNLQANQDIDWNNGFLFVAKNSGVARAGDLNLVAGRQIDVQGAFSTADGDWSMTANAPALVDAQRGAGFGGIQLLQAQFLNDNGKLPLRVADGAGNSERQAGSIGIGKFSGKGLSASIDPSVPDADGARILLYHDVDVAEGIQLTGNLQTASQGAGGSTLTLRGATVDWTNETSGGRYRGGIVQFIENGQVTRIGKGGAGADATRLELGSADSYSRTYGDADPSAYALGALQLKQAAHNVTAAGAPLGEVLAAGSLNVSGPGVAANAGSHSLTLSANPSVAFKPVEYNDEGTAVSGAAGGYFIDLRPGTVALNVDKRVVTPTVLNPSYVYGSPSAAVGLGNVVNGDALAPVATLGSSTGVAMSAIGAGYGFGARVGAGTHAYTLTGLAGAAAGNYSLDLSRGIGGLISIAPKPVTFFGSSASQVYGDAFTPLTMYLDGVLPGDAVAAGTQALRALDVKAAGGSGMRSAGTYAVDVTSLEGAQAGNYSLAASGNGAPVLTITPRPLTYGVSGQVNSTYGTAATGLPTASLGNVVAGDLITGNLAAFDWQGAHDIEDRTRAGSYALGVRSFSGAGSDNYQVAASGNVAGQLDVAPKPIHFAGAESTQVYGQSTLPSPGLAGTLPGDDVRPGAQQLNMFFAANPGESGALPIGTYQVGLSGLAGNDAANYVLQSGGNTPNSVAITPRPLTFTLGGGSSNTTYGTAPVLPDFTLSNIVEGDRISGSVAAFRVGVAYAPGAKTPAGSYAWGVDGLTGLGAGNYVVSFAGSSLFPLTVAPKPVTWQVASGTAVYGDALSNATALSGVLAGDDVSAQLQAIDGSGSTVGRPVVGSAYTAAVTSLGGGASGNYALQASGNAAGGLVITPRPVGYSVADVGVTYGNLATAGAITLTNVVPGETLNPTLAIRASGGGLVTLTERTDAGQYQQQVTALGNANYMLAGTGNLPGVLSIAPRALTYATPDITSIYGDVADLSARGSLAGLLSGDDVRAGATVRSSIYSQPWDAGTYADIFRVGGLEGGKAGNYVLSDAGSRLGTHTILPRPLTYAVQVRSNGSLGQDYIYGDLRTYFGIAPFDASSVLSGVLNDDRLRVAMQPTAPALRLSNGGNYVVGSYTWGRGALSGDKAGNYVLADGGHTDFTLNIRPRDVDIRFGLWREATPVSSLQYGNTVATTLQMYNTFLGGDDVYGFAAVAAGGIELTSVPSRLAVGAYSVGLLGNALGGADAANYRAHVTPFKFEVTPKPLAAQLDASRSTYGTQAVVSTPRLFGVVEDDEVSGLVTVTNGAGASLTLAPRTDAGTYGTAITGLAGAAAGNYYLETRNQPAGYNFSSVHTIDRKQLGYSLATGDLNRTYGDYIALPGMLSGVLAGDAVAVTPTATPLEATATGSLAARDLSQLPMLDAGRYSYTGVLSGASAGNYSVAALGTLVVNKRVVTADFGVGQRTYGTYLPLQVSFDNVVPGQQLGFLEQDPTRYSERTPAGRYFDYLTLSGSTAPNYTLANPYREWTVAPKPLAVAATAQSSTIYGTAGSFGTFDASGILFNDDVGVLVRGPGLADRLVAPGADGQLAALARQNAGSYAFALSLAGWGSGNYRLEGPTQGTLNVAPKPLALAAEAQLSAVYGSAFQVGTLGGVLSGDDVGVTVAGGLPPARLVPDSTGALAYGGRVDAGGYAFSIGNSLSGAQAANYTVAGGAAGQLTVTPKPVIYSVDDSSGQYGNFRACDQWSCNRWEPGAQLGQARFEGVLPGDTLNGTVGLVDLNGTPGVIDGTTPIGTYFQVVNGLTGASAGNYRIAASGSRPGIMTIDPVWLSYSTTSGVYLPTTGVVGQPGVATIRVAGRVGALNGDQVTPVVALFSPSGQQINDFSAYVRDRSAAQLNGARFTYRVVALQGRDAANYRILGADEMGSLDFYLNSSLGLNYASTSIAVPKTEEIKPFSLPENQELKNTVATTTLTPDFGRNITINDSSASATTDGTSGRVAGAASAVAGADVQIGPVNLSTQASGAASALLNYGVTGVTLRANAGSHIDVMMQVGPGYVMAGLQADAAVEGTVGPTSASLAAQVKVGASASAGASGSLGNGVGDGHLSTTATSFAIARTDYTLGLKDNKLQQSLDLVIGSGVSAGARGGISGSTGAIDAGVTVYSPGSLGAKLDINAGIKNGALTVGFDIGAQIGIAGLGLSFSFSIDPMAFAGSIANSAFGKAVLSAFGIDPNPRKIAEWPPRVLGAADALKNDPVARFKYLSEHPDWKDYNTNSSSSTQKDTDSYLATAGFYNAYQGLLERTASLITRQGEVQARFMELLKTDPAAAIEYSRSGELAQMKMAQIDVSSDARKLGVQLAVTDGKVSFVSRPQ